MSDVIRYEVMTDKQLARIFARYLFAITRRDDGNMFEFPRKAMITELGRMSRWLRAHVIVDESMNGWRQL